MGQITHETVRCIEDAFAKGADFPLTIWEKTQLARAWVAAQSLPAAPMTPEEKALRSWMPPAAPAEVSELPPFPKHPDTRNRDYWLMGEHAVIKAYGEACFQAGRATPSVQPDVEAVSEARDAAREARAKTIYESWKGQPGYVPWMEGGNSLMQDRARQQAADNYDAAAHAKAYPGY
jgi:hypothetical protein